MGGGFKSPPIKQTMNSRARATNRTARNMVLLIKMLTMDVERSDQERRLRILIQRLAVLEGEQEAGQMSGHGDQFKEDGAALTKEELRQHT